LGKLARSLQQPVVQLDTSVLEDSLRVDSISFEWLIENKQNVDERHCIIIEHKNGTFETVEHKSD